MPAGNMGEQCADRGRGRWRSRGLADELGSREASGEETNGRGLYVAFAPRNLTCETQAGLSLQTQSFVQQLRRVDEGVSVQTAEAGELRLREARDGAEDADLLAVFQLGLEPDHVEQGGELVVL